MGRFYGILACVVLAMTVAGPAGAVVNYLSIDWTGTIKTVNLTVAGTGIQSAGIAVASGYLDNVYDHQNTAGGHTLPRLFCVDLFQFAYDTTPANNYEWDVHHYTGADGNTGWLTPSYGTDRWRDHGSLQRVAYLANKWGTGNWLSTGSATQQYDKTISLNVALWKAAYGDRFSLTGNGNLSAQELNYFNVYMADYATGGVSKNYSWYDSNSQDTDDRYQDFIEPLHAATPEPGTILLLGSGLLGSGLILKRRRP